MRKTKIEDAQGRELFADACEMVGIVERMRGMTALAEAPADDFAMIFRLCPRVQCKAMRFPIDVAHLDRDGHVLAVATVAPGQMGPAVKGCRTCVEMRAGRAAELGIEPGCVLRAKRAQMPPFDTRTGSNRSRNA
ncbi:MAG: DUF192 domain-containing protein [Senegalimassilia sp.]|nr:DUF192 domain-containing protein [Senegalimassilia sp.]